MQKNTKASKKHIDLKKGTFDVCWMGVIQVFISTIYRNINIYIY